MQPKYKVLIAIAALLGAYAFGRFASPVKIVTEIHTVEVEKKVTDKEREKHQTTTITETAAPDGTKTKTTTITQDTETKVKSTTDVARSTDSTTTRVYNQSKVHLNVLSGVQISSPGGGIPIVYGASASKDLIGPISVGVWGLTNGIAGLSIGISF